MRFLHCADLHIGKGQNLPNFLDYTRAAIHRIIDVAIEKKVDAIVIAGDVFHVIAPSRPIALFGEMMFLELIQTGIPILVISGNHDRKGSFASAIHQLVVLSWHHKNLYVAEHYPRWVRICGRHYFLLVPHQGSTTALQAIVAKEMLCLSHLAETAETVTVVAHEAISGSVNDIGFRVPGIELPDELGVNYWALGDIHKMQRMARNAWYPGAPIQGDFGELPPKGVLIVDSSNFNDPEFVLFDGIRELVTIDKVEQAIDTPNVFYRQKLAVGQVPDAADAEQHANIVAVAREVAPEVHVDLSHGLESAFRQFYAEQGNDDPWLELLVAESLDVVNACT